jgi:hypothetical protein
MEVHVVLRMNAPMLLRRAYCQSIFALFTELVAFRFG